MYRWANIDTSIPLAAGDQPYNIQLMAEFMGRPFEELNTHQLERMQGEIWPEFVKELGMQFLFQAAQNPVFASFLELGDDIAALDPSSPTYIEDLGALAAAATSAAAAVTPAYEYLERFTGLSFDPSTGAISGDFNAFVAAFIEDEPPFLTTFVSSGGGGGGGGGAGGTIYMPAGSDEDFGHPWMSWYKNQGSLVFNIAAAMGIDLGLCP